MRKIFGILKVADSAIATAILISALAFGFSNSASAANNKITVNIGSVSAKAGETVSIPVSVSGGSNAIASTGITFEFDSRLKLHNVSRKDSYAMEYYTGNHTVSVSVVTASESEETSVHDGKTLYNLEFEVPSDAKAGDYSVSVKEIDCFKDINGKPIEYDTKSGGINVKPTTTTEKTTITSKTTTATTQTGRKTISNIKSDEADKFTYIYNIKINLKASDPNGDGVIDSEDATVILIDYANYLLNGTRTLTNEQADSNGDGVVDSEDATNILIYYANELLKSF